MSSSLLILYSSPLDFESFKTTLELFRGHHFFANFMNHPSLKRCLKVCEDKHLGPEGVREMLSRTIFSIWYVMNMK